MLPTDRYFNYPHHVLQKPELDEDHHSHVAVWLLARTNNIVHGTVQSSKQTGTDTFQNLKLDLERWQLYSPAGSQPLMREDPEQDSQTGNPFPGVLFSHEGAAVAYMLWLTAKILLVDYAVTKLGQVHERSRLYDFARTVCGIVETQKQSSTVLVESIHPLWICGQRLTIRAERFAVLELLARVERVIGWKTAWRAANLHEIWSAA